MNHTTEVLVQGNANTVLALSEELFESLEIRIKSRPSYPIPFAAAKGANNDEFHRPQPALPADGIGLFCQRPVRRRRHAG